MKQRILLFFVGILCSLGTWAATTATETPGNTGTSNSNLTGTSYTIGGTWVAGAGGAKVAPMESKGVKLRTSSALEISVNEGCVINSLVIYGISNDNSNTVTVSSITIDGGNNVLSESVVLPNKKASAAATINLSNIDATSKIVITFGEGAGTQIVLDPHFTYTAEETKTQEINAVSLNGTAISATDLATLKSSKSVTIDGSSLNGCGNLDVTLSSGSTTVTKSIADGTATYSFKINSTDEYTVKVSNLAKTYSASGTIIAYQEDDTKITGADTYTVTMNDITFTFEDDSKKFGYGAGKVTLGTKVYVPLKLSTGSAVSVTFPTGFTASKVKIYGWSESGNGKLYFLKESNDDDAKSVNVSSDVYYATNQAIDIYPSVYEYTLDDWSSASFSAAGSPSQPYVVMEFTLNSSKTPSDLAVTYDESQLNLDVTTQIAYTTSSTGTVTVSSSDETVATATIDTANKKVSITGKSAGTATITISQAADDTYDKGSKTIEVTVTDPYAGTVVYNWNTVGTTTLDGSKATSTTVKIKNVSTNCIKFANSLSSNCYAKIEAKDNDTFKAGDVITWTGCINNSTTTKDGAIMIAKEAADGTILLDASDKFNNTYDTSIEASTGSYTLTEDATSLYIGRTNKTEYLSNATATCVTQLTVTRPATLATITLNDKGYATLSYNKNVFVSGAKVYTASVNTSSSNEIKCTKVATNIVPAYNGVILYGEADATVKLLYQNSAAALSNNELAATTIDGGTATPAEGDLTLDGTVFKKFTGTLFNANKAYFPAAKVNNAKAYTIVFEDAEATGIDSIVTVEQPANNAAYNIAGQRVNANAKGIVIIGGKKYFNK